MKATAPNVKLRAALESAIYECLCSHEFQSLPPTLLYTNDCLEGNAGLPRPQRKAQLLADAILSDATLKAFFK